MDNLYRIPTWRKVLIVVFALIVLVCLILLGNIDNIITHEESEKNKPSLIIEKDDILSRILSFDELSDERRREFQLNQEERLKKYRTPSTYGKACNILYNNIKFKRVFSTELFDSLESIGAGYDYRCEILRNKVVSDAFNYLYSPFTPNGTRDNRIGLGTDWEEYNQMSIPAKEDYIRSDFQERYEKIVEKENNHRDLWKSILFSIVLVSGLSIFCLVVNRIGKKNIHARNLALYTIISFVIAFVICIVMAIGNHDLDDILVVIILYYLPSVVVLSMMEVFLARKSHQNYYSYYLIPEWLLKKLNITNEFRKRLLMSFLIYPFFYIVPLPLVGILFFAFYIIPVLLILGIIWIVLWIREGKKMDCKPQAQNDKARLYCRHCGKLIDADSDFCRYCGKKL